MGFHVYNLKVYSCDQYKIFFHLYGNGGANWVSEYKKYILEEAAEWTYIPGKRQNARPLNSASNCLSGANRIPLGHSWKNSFQNHKPSHLQSYLGVLKKSRNPVPSPRLTTVFQRLRWPEEIRNSLSVSSKNTDIEGQVRKLHWKRKDNPKPPKDHHSEFIDRGKKPMIDSSPTVCSVCIRGDSLPSCQNWATCVKCKQKGHLDRHCRAKWQPTGRKVNLHHVCSGRKTNPNEAATSKEPIYPLLIDITTDSVDDPSIDVPNTELSLFFRTQNPPKLRQISSPSETFVQLVGALPQSSDGVSTC
jgi:hypothetical protein